jgi:hypothetical protein
VLALAAGLFFVPVGFRAFARQAPHGAAAARGGDDFIAYIGEDGHAECREATPAERAELSRADLSTQGMHAIRPSPRAFDSKSTTAAAAEVPTKIILRGTEQLEAHPEAKAAFIRAALTWESKILSPIKIYIDVDYGATRFGQSWPAGNPLGATSSYAGEYLYEEVRQHMIAGATTPAELSLYNSLPPNALPTDKGDYAFISVSDSIARALALMPAAAEEADLAPRISFNSYYDDAFDFDPSDGIDSNKYDFEMTAAHEIGHALGFISRNAREDGSAPAVWDMFRFRAGTTLETFGTAPRVMTASGDQYYFSGGKDLQLSTGGSNGEPLEENLHHLRRHDRAGLLRHPLGSLTERRHRAQLLRLRHRPERARPAAAAERPLPRRAAARGLFGQRGGHERLRETRALRAVARGGRRLGLVQVDGRSQRLREVQHRGRGDGFRHHRGGRHRRRPGELHARQLG